MRALAFCCLAAAWQEIRNARRHTCWNKSKHKTRRNHLPYCSTEAKRFLYIRACSLIQRVSKNQRRHRRQHFQWFSISRGTHATIRTFLLHTVWMFCMPSIMQCWNLCVVVVEYLLLLLVLATATKKVRFCAGSEQTTDRVLPSLHNCQVWNYIDDNHGFSLSLPSWKGNDKVGCDTFSHHKENMSRWERDIEINDWWLRMI